MDERDQPAEANDIFIVDIDEDISDSESDEYRVPQDTESSDDDDELVWEPLTRRMSAMYKFKPHELIKIPYRSLHAQQEYPTPRSGHRVIASSSHLYSLGGFNPRSAVMAARNRNRGSLLFQELWSFNFATNKWKLLLHAKNAANMPTELASNALVIRNDTLISHGGTGYPFGESCSNDCFVYNIDEKNPSVQRLSVSGDLPTALYGPGIVLHKNYLYTIGGTTGFDYSCDVFRLDLKTNVWENVCICRPEMRDDPQGRYRHELVYDGKFIYVLGGGTTDLVFDLQSLPAFNLEKNTWVIFKTLPDPSMTSMSSEVTGYPRPRKCFSCVQHTSSNGDIEAFVTGGTQGDSGTYFSDIWRLNIRTMQWTWIRTSRLPKPLYFHSAAHAGNGCMYIFGGIEYNHKDIRRRNDLYKMWMTIPKLSEMCWDALLHYNGNLQQYNRYTLLKSGIPERFVNRLSLEPQRSPKQTHNSISRESISPQVRPLKRSRSATGQ